MDGKKAKRRRNNILIAMFLVLLWIGLSVRVYLHESSPSRVHTQGSGDGFRTDYGVVSDGDGYRCVNFEVESDRGYVTVMCYYYWFGSRTDTILREEWRVLVLEQDLPGDADREKLFEEAFERFVADGSPPNWPGITRAQSKSYVVEYPNRQAENKRLIAAQSFGKTAPKMFILCAFVAFVRSAWIAATDKPRPGICPDCDYNLGGLKDKQCPECGRGFDDKKWRFHMSE